jgi:glutathione S-transferase
MHPGTERGVFASKPGRKPEMPDELVFYTNPMSRGRMVRWMLEEVGKPYRAEIVEYGPQMKSAPYTDVNPMGKVPALTHDGTVITECGAIIAYLADAFPEAGLAPAPGSKARGSYYRWMFYAAGPVEAATTNKALGMTPSEERRGMLGYGSMEDVLKTLEKAVTDSEYLAGDKFTAADIYLGSQIGWTMQFGILEKRPALVEYFARIKDRPAAIRAREIDDALLPKKE